MELKTESMENMKKVVAKCLDELMMKPDLTPGETKAALDGFKLHDELCCRIEDCKNEEDMKSDYSDRRYSERGYSGYSSSNRPYHITSYGYPERAYSERNSRRMSRDSGTSYGYSNGPSYGYSDAPGWYQSNNYPMPMRGYGHESYYGNQYNNGSEYSDRRGYSRHSIGDRVVSMVEKMMDSAESDYEKQELQKYIKTIRAMTMAE